MSSIGFGTLALGPEYRQLCRLLAYDLSILHPEITLYVLTDRPEFFSQMSNVTAYKHIFGGVRYCYHDKRHVVSLVLKSCDVCIFLDADCRVISPIDLSEITSNKCFISGPWVENLKDKLEEELESWTPKISLNTPMRKRKILNRISQHFGLQLENITYIHEAFFVVQKKYGNYREFLKCWGYACKFSTTRLFEFSTGSSIGIAAAASSCGVGGMDKFPAWLFKDLYKVGSTKTKEQLNVSEKMGLLRKSIASEYKKRIKFHLPLIYAGRYAKFILKGNG